MCKGGGGLLVKVCMRLGTMEVNIYMVRVGISAGLRVYVGLVVRTVVCGRVWVGSGLW